MEKVLKVIATIILGILAFKIAWWLVKVVFSALGFVLGGALYIIFTLLTFAIIAVPSYFLGKFIINKFSK